MDTKDFDETLVLLAPDPKDNGLKPFEPGFGKQQATFIENVPWDSKKS